MASAKSSNKEKKRLVTLSVHELVDFLCREGDIDNRVYNADTMQLGSKLHASFQEKQGRDYLSEVPLVGTIEREKATVILEGRADGIIVGGPFPVIDEIKTTVMPLEDFYHQQKAWHYAQAECYGYLYLLNHPDLSRECGIRLTYISQQDAKQKMVKEEKFTFAELEKDVLSLVDRHLQFDEEEFKHLALRNESAAALPFPYAHFRPGQREMAKYIYALMSKKQSKNVFFFEAPTGIGKTISAIYPALKSFAKGTNAKLFYLTAKGSGRQAAFDAMTSCYEKGFIGRDSWLVAKEKICFNPGMECNPDACPFAKDYYGKLRQVMTEENQANHRFSPEYVTDVARHYAMCPFELQLDLSLIADVILCDYNYFFDPLVRLDRYFGPEADPSRDIVLIDEAHNLPSRARDMYSESIRLSLLDKAKEELSSYKVFKGIKSARKKLQMALEEVEQAEKDPFTILPTFPDSVLDALIRFSDATKKKQVGDVALPASVKELSRVAYRMSYLVSECDENCVTYAIRRSNHDFELRWQCLDASPWIKESIDRVRGTAVFSATLSPMEFYERSIYGEEDLPFLTFPSPFPPEHLHLMVAPKVSTRYKNRDQTYEEVARYLSAFVEAKTGNYFLFFPSYDYLAKITPYFSFGDADVYTQERDMNDDEKDLFLSRFLSHPKKTSIGLLIIGGSFSEGVDLMADRLSGVAVVGIGLPQVSPESNALRDYYEAKNGKGFAYAYRNPGINKVMQAVGRLIRSENDIGSALLIDDRYLQGEYRALFSRVWKQYEIVLSPEEVKTSMTEFYRKQDKGAIIPKD